VAATKNLTRRHKRNGPSAGTLRPEAYLMLCQTGSRHASDYELNAWGCLSGFGHAKSPQITGPRANSPNGILYVGKFLRLNSRVPSRVGTRALSGRSRCTAPRRGRFFGHLASKSEFNGIGGLRSYIQTRAGSSPARLPRAAPVLELGPFLWYWPRPFARANSRWEPFCDLLIYGPCAPRRVHTSSTASAPLGLGRLLQEASMGRGILLWLLGVPIPIIILLWLFFGR
jgi:hypothetical protein